MSLQEAAFILVWSLLAIAAWAGIILVIPWCQRSRFRYRLWRLRDKVTDDLIRDALPRSDAVIELREQIDDSIRYSRDFTFLNFLLAYTVAEKYSRLAVQRASRDDLRPEEAERLKQYESQLEEAQTVHLLTGSVSGWVGTVLLAILSFPKLTSRGQDRSPKELMAQKVTNEVASQPELWVPRRRLARDRRDGHEADQSRSAFVS
jgi:hypothetical protein